MKTAILYATSLAPNLLGWFLIVLAGIFSRGRNLEWKTLAYPGIPGLWCYLPDGWLYRSIRAIFRKVKGDPDSDWKGITLCNGGIFGPTATPATRRHENRHTEQFNVIAALILIVEGIQAIAHGGWLAPLFVWAGCWFLFVRTATVTAILRDEPGYRGSFHEEHARGSD